MFVITQMNHEICHKIINLKLWPPKKLILQIGGGGGGGWRGGLSSEDKWLGIEHNFDIYYKDYW